LRARGFVVCDRLCDRLIVDVELVLERVELWLAKYRPPDPAWIASDGLAIFQLALPL
jgi:hypothetical protein